MKIFSSALTTYLHERKLKQSTLARMLGVSHVSVYYYTRGISAPQHLSTVVSLGCPVLTSSYLADRCESALLYLQDPQIFDSFMRIAEDLHAS